jgi:hypothetical protein
MHSVPVPINVRCYSNSDIIVRRSEMTLRAISRLMHRRMISETQTQRPPRPGRVKTHTSGKCRKYNSSTRHQTVYLQHHPFHDAQFSENISTRVAGV